MPSIRQTFYGLFRQFSSSNIEYTPPLTPSDGQLPSVNDGATPRGSSTNGHDEKTLSRNVSVYQSLPRRRNRNSFPVVNENSARGKPDDPSKQLPTVSQKRNSSASTNGQLKSQQVTKSLAYSQQSKASHQTKQRANKIPAENCRPIRQDESKCFIGEYLDGSCIKRNQPEIYHGKTGIDLPVFKLEPLQVKCLSAYTGPDGGLTKKLVPTVFTNSCIVEVPPVRCKRPLASIANLDDELSLSFEADSFLNVDKNDGSKLYNISPLSSINNLTRSYLNDEDIVGVNDKRLSLEYQGSDFQKNQKEVIDWFSSSNFAYGLSASLYEKNPITHVHAGNPVADVFAIVARQNSCVLCLADGVNWGEKSRLAARCAVRGSVDYLNESIFSANSKQPCTTLDVFHYLLRSFHAGHKLIVQENGSLTTLCVVILWPLKNAVNQWAACACNVGDSLAFVYSPKTGVREITQGSHDIQEMRDMRDAGGALGPVDGVNPELHNMTCSMTVVEAGDFVFITSDGISDNFDPVVGKFCVSRPPNVESGVAIKRAETSREHSLRGSKIGKKFPSLDSSVRMSETKPLPTVEAYQRHELMLLRLEDMLRHGVNVGDPSVYTAKGLCENLVNFAIQLTSAKRKTLEDPDLYKNDVDRRDKTHAAMQRDEQKRRRHAVRQKISEMPGKLDHASVVAYQIPIDHIALDSTSQGNNPDDRFNFVTEDQITAKSGLEPEDDETWLFTLFYKEDMSNTNTENPCEKNECPDRSSEGSSAVTTKKMKQIQPNFEPAHSSNSPIFCKIPAVKNETSSLIPNGQSVDVPIAESPPKVACEHLQLAIEKPEFVANKSKFRNFSKTFEKFVDGVRRPKKHSRNSPHRHTVAVDTEKISEARAMASTSTTHGQTFNSTPPIFRRWSGSKWSPIKSVKSSGAAAQENLAEQTIAEDDGRVENNSGSEAVFVRKNCNSSQTSLTLSEVQLAFANLQLCPESYV